jgi:carbon storage regulator
MLVLSRRLGEQVVINDSITVTVLAIEDARIRLGFEAPPGVRIDRREVHERRLRERGLPVPLATRERTGVQRHDVT